MKKKICDLHIHSTFSDGTDTPERIFELAMEKGLSAIALTDHNTVKGLEIFNECAKNYDIDAVPGVEFSTEYNGKEVHIVALFIEPEHYGDVVAYVDEVKKRKEKSNIEILERMARDGYDVSYDELKNELGDIYINRACIAAYLCRKGYLENVSDAFDTILSPKGGYYVPPKKVDSIKTIEFIRSINAVSVLAHPLLNLSEAELNDFIPNAKSAGLVAMEVRHGDFTAEYIKKASRLARKYKLLSSGGSDYHGENQPHISLGVVNGCESVPYKYYLKLLKYKKKLNKC